MPGSVYGLVICGFSKNKAGYTSRHKSRRLGRGSNAQKSTRKKCAVGRTDRPTDNPSYRVAWTRLKTEDEQISRKWKRWREWRPWNCLPHVVLAWWFDQHTFCYMRHLNVSLHVSPSLTVPAPSKMVTLALFPTPSTREKIRAKPWKEETRPDTRPSVASRAGAHGQ